MGARLTAVPGASDFFRGAIVSYDVDVKYDLLGVPDGPGRERGRGHRHGDRARPGSSAPTSVWR